MAVVSKNFVATSDSEIQFEANTAENRKKPSWSPWRASGKSEQNRADWRPRSLRPTFLILVIAVSLALIAVLQYLLVRSERDNGIIFADDITALPLSRSFPYLYLPTIIAVIYGFAWTWIDLDVRRMEPFFQLAKEGGAPAEQSMLLSYPVDFIASVPLKALRYRHWSPFVASFATVFVFWGLTPSQAGIFATSAVNQTIILPMAYSTSHLSLDQQAESLSAKSATSVSSILWLNETLQPFMTRDAMLAPFGPISENADSVRGFWTSETWQYFANVSCEDAIVWKKNDAYWLNSTWGCSYTAPSLRTRAVLNETNEAKIFDTLYVGYYNDNGNAPYYLSNRGCPATDPNSFIVQFSKVLVPTREFVNMTATEQRDNADVTTLFCRSNYFTQRVQATVQLPGRSVVEIVPQDDAQPLPSNLFNTSVFEASMSQGQDKARTDFPSLDWPDQTSYLKDTDLFLGFMSRMAPFAIGSTKFPMANYLDQRNLQESYQRAYQLLFSRQLADVVMPSFDEQTSSNGTIRFETQAVIVVPTFVYIVEGLLGAACLCAIGILCLSSRRPTKLYSDPGSLAATMSLVADDNAVPRLLADLDTATIDELDVALQGSAFRLQASSTMDTALCIKVQSLTPTDGRHDRSEPPKPMYQRSEGSLPGVQPIELSLKVGLAFFLCLLAVGVVLGLLFAQTQKLNGLALPTQDRFVRQLLENYIPTGIATLIEPFWLLINRNLCHLQPFEELRKRPQSPSRSLGTNYVSLPPQLVAGMAAINGHILLTTVCVMTLLANVLSVSLSGLFLEKIVDYPVDTRFSQSSSMRFAALDASAAPIVATTGDSITPFYIATSNQTANTTLPAWIDESLFYQPFENLQENDTAETRQRASTRAIGATLDCKPLSQDSRFDVVGTTFDSRGFEVISHNTLSVVLQRNESQITCIPRNEIASGFNLDPKDVVLGSRGKSAFEFTYALQGTNDSTMEDNKFCQQHLALGYVHATLTNGTTFKPGAEEAVEVPIVVESHSEFILVCTSRMVAGTATVTVSADGHVLDAADLDIQAAEAGLFSTSAADVIGQAHHSILRAGRRWHNDSNPSDFGNYLVAQAMDSNILLDPNSEFPSATIISNEFGRLYSKLYAIWLQQNQAQLFESDSRVLINGVEIAPQTRIFMSKTMFILAESILISYMVVTILLYLHRPWKILCRLPTSLASVLAYCAASRALDDFRNTAHLSGPQLALHLKRVGHAYGFGSFMAEDKSPHVGIERTPFVVPLTRSAIYTTSTEPYQSQNSSASVRWRRRVQDWKSGKAREGGWL